MYKYAHTMSLACGRIEFDLGFSVAGQRDRFASGVCYVEGRVNNSVIAAPELGEWRPSASTRAAGRLRVSASTVVKVVRVALRADVVGTAVTRGRARLLAWRHARIVL